MKSIIIYIFIMLSMICQKSLGQGKPNSGVNDCLVHYIKKGLIFKSVKQMQHLKVDAHNIDSLTSIESPISFFVFYCDTLNLERFKSIYFIGTIYNIYACNLIIDGKNIACKVHEIIPSNAHAESDINFIKEYKPSCLEGGRITKRFYVKTKACKGKYIFIEFSRKSKFKMRSEDYLVENTIIESFN